ncbi:stevor PIR protein, putative [Plasmodium reichenowi]|uniref:Stevor PIR protein, putative n=1 Tax=Plasmodium reichenowi TaxID=5854 RepID=A0A2P9D1F6_PLARE|nr:stevor PIR protein, putative [Plasmodium reichenowi]
MNTYFVKMLLFSFLINTLVLPHNENYINNHYNVSLIRKNTQRAIIKSRLLAQTQKHNPHYHNDPELKEMIDKLNDEAIKKYQQTHEPYEQLREIVEKSGTKLTGGNSKEPMSTTEKELLETYEEIFGHKSDIMLKSGMYPNDDDTSDKSSSCECTNTDNTDLTKRKGKDKYLKHLKHRCTRAICFCSVGSLFLTFIGLAAARATAVAPLNITVSGVNYNIYALYVTIFNMFNETSMIAAIDAGAGASVAGLSDLLTSTVTSSASAIFGGFGIAALVLLILAVVLIILYIWLYKRRKRSLKHECKKHLCK